jgi:putative component of toxin-antitoxin plasmid stabilization module
VLGVSPGLRAEIIFLVQLDLLKERSIGDADMVRDGLMEMANDVEAGSGVWSIIKERKRSKISKHIDRYPF